VRREKRGGGEKKKKEEVRGKEKEKRRLCDPRPLKKQGKRKSQKRNTLTLHYPPQRKSQSIIPQHTPNEAHGRAGKKNDPKERNFTGKARLLIVRMVEMRRKEKRGEGEMSSTALQCNRQ